MHRLHSHLTASCRRVRLPAVLLLALLGLGLLAAPAAESRTGYPKVLNFYFPNTVSDEELEILSRWDVLVLDSNFPLENPDAIPRLRSLNPDIVILGYIPINGIWIDGYLQQPYLVSYRFWEGVDDGDFWLRSVDGSIVSDWPHKGSTNLTPNSPTNSRGEKYWEWFARFVYEDIWEQGNGPFDGLFLDDVWDSISWLNSLIESPIDSDRNGVADDPATLDAWWREANGLCTARIRQLVGPNVPVMSNGGNFHHAALNGTMLENFATMGRPDQNNMYGYVWREWMIGSPVAYFPGLANYNPDPMKLMTLNAHWRTVDGVLDRTGRFEAHKRLCLGSTLLGDGYFSFDAEWDEHGSLWWEPEYDLYLGQPLGPAYEVVNGPVTVWRRDYEAGMVVVNPNNDSSPFTTELPFIGPWDAYIGPPPDTQAPEPVSTAAAEVLDSGSVRLTWNAVFDPGGSGVASRYDVRYATSPITAGPPWIQATRVDQSLVPLQEGAAESVTVTGLAPNTTYYFCVRVFDSWDNLSGIGVVPSATTPDDGGPPPDDVTAPAAVADLDTVAVDTASVVFRWTAVGDDGTTGTAAVTHGRYATQPVTESGWDQASPVPGLPAPAPAGTPQESSLGGLAPGTTYYLGMRAEDEAGNLGSLGPVLAFTTDDPPPPPPPPPADTEGPATVTDMTAFQTGETWVQLRFTAPADAQGTVTAYDLRYLKGAVFDTAAWSGAHLAPAPDPAAPGTTVYALVTGLTAGTEYAFRVRSVDDSGNWSDRSPVTVGLTKSPPPPPPPDTTGPAAVADLEVVAAGESWLDLTFTAPADAEGSVASYQLRRVEGAGFDPAAWDGATAVSTGTPGAPGTAEGVRAEGLLSGVTYAFRIRAVDDSGNPGPMSAAAVGITSVPPPPPPPPPPADTTAPAPVTDLDVASADTSGVRLTWTAVGDDGTAGQAALYHLRWRAETIDPSTWDEATPVAGLVRPLPAGWGESFVVRGLPLETLVAFALVVEDSSGNASPLGNRVTVFLQGPEPPDTRPPGTLEDVEVVDRDAAGITLRWSPGPEPDLSHYRVYRGRRPGSALTLYRDRVDSCCVEDRRVVPGRSYAYAVTAVDAAGNESGFSRQMEVVVPWDAFDRRPMEHFLLGEPWPNPSAGRVQFTVETGAEVTVRVEVFDVNGRRVRLLPERRLSPGDAVLAWDGADDSGRRVGRGIYFLRVRGGTAHQTRKVHLLP